MNLRDKFSSLDEVDLCHLVVALKWYVHSLPNDSIRKLFQDTLDKLYGKENWVMNLLKLNVVFKGVSKRDGGEFTNDKGEIIKYDPSFIVKFDEDVNGEIVERRLKFPITNKALEHKLKEVEAYSKIVLLCDVQLYSANAKVLPIDME